MQRKYLNKFSVEENIVKGLDRSQITPKINKRDKLYLFTVEICPNYSKNSKFMKIDQKL